MENDLDDAHKAIKETIALIDQTLRDLGVHHAPVVTLLTEADFNTADLLLLPVAPRL